MSDTKKPMNPTLQIALTWGTPVVAVVAAGTGGYLLGRNHGKKAQAQFVNAKAIGGK